ncbi:MAG TPA: hypothetical protein IAA34_04395 [Candidatus Enterococcus stercoripullorum]|nr:hypothetical protein [Candidatus Enterococcus stercoripullorum]
MLFAEPPVIRFFKMFGLVVFLLCLFVIGVGVYRNATITRTEKIANTYTLVNLKSDETQTELMKSEGNSLIGQFFIGSTTKQEKTNKTTLSVKYAIQTNQGMQFKNFEEEYKTSIFSKNVYFKELKQGKAKLEVYGEFLGSDKDPDSLTRFVFTLPKKDIQAIMSKY